MNVQGVSSFQDRDHRRSAILPGYMSGFGNSFETEALEGALPIGRNSPQKIELRALCRTALRLALHRAAGHQSALMALSHPTERQAFGPLRESRQGPDADRAGARETRDLPIGQLRWDPTPLPDGEVTFLERSAHHHDGRRFRHAGRHGGACAARHRIHDRMRISSMPTANISSSRRRMPFGSAPNSASSISNRAKSASFRAA